jgi:glucose-1-phosphate adenylyltransferase
MVVLQRTSTHCPAKNDTIQGLRRIVSQRVLSSRAHGAKRVGSKMIVSRAQALQTQHPPLASIEALPGVASQAITGVGKDDLQMSKTVLGIILGGGAGTRLYPLTKKRAKPAVPLGANYRLIDIPVSNCVNSNVTKIYCLTQFNSASLNRHLSQAYNSSVGAYTSRGFVEVLAASQSNVRKEWFQGTADAVRQYMWLFEEAMRDGVQDFLILSGDHLYRMDYKDFVRKHRESGAAITIAALPCDEKRASAFGLMKIDEAGRVTEFAEKPKGDALKAMQVDTRVLGVDSKTAAEKPYIASMGIYVMKAEALKELLEQHMPDANDFGNEVIPGARSLGYPVQAYAFQGYWEDIGTIEAFYNANLALVKTDGSANFSFYDKDAPIYTMSRFLPPSKVLNDVLIKNSIIGDGSNIKSRSRVENSIIGLRSLIGENVVIEDTLMLGSDYYETMEECAWVPGCLPMGVGSGSHIRKALIDKNARIGENVKILNKDGVMEANRESEGFMIRDGIVVVIKDSVIPSGTVI